MPIEYYTPSALFSFSFYDAPVEHMQWLIVNLCGLWFFSLCALIVHISPSHSLVDSLSVYSAREFLNSAAFLYL